MIGVSGIQAVKVSPAAVTQIALNPAQKGVRAREFENKLASRIIGQERAVRRMSSLYQVFLAGMQSPNRPIGTMLFLGPTGSGKTRVV
jgi:ATP-dependent Clp protease ATP-binding subunit ClpA